MVKIASESKWFAFGKISRLQFITGASEVWIEDIVGFVDANATRVIPKALLKRPRFGPKQIIIEIHVARSLVQVNDPEFSDSHAKRVVRIMHDIKSHLRVQPVKRAAT